MATPGTEACDAVGGALRPKWREWRMVKNLKRIEKAWFPVSQFSPTAGF